jgi:hypothetical protein
MHATEKVCVIYLVVVIWAALVLSNWRTIKGWCEGVIQWLLS